MKKPQETISVGSYAGNGDIIEEVNRLSRRRKSQLAGIIKLSPVRCLMSLGVRLTVPRHRTGVVTVGYNDSGQILMLKHVFHPMTPWGLPGGWLEKGESPEVCARRELREETGLSAKFGPIIYHSFETTPRHLGFAFIAKISPGTINLSSEIIDADWFDPTALPGPLLPFVHNAISAAGSFINHWEKMGTRKYE